MNTTTAILITAIGGIFFAILLNLLEKELDKKKLRHPGEFYIRAYGNLANIIIIITLFMQIFL